MDSDDSQQRETARSRIAQVIRSLEGDPLWWRSALEEIAAGLEAGHTSRTEAAQQVAEIIGIARASQTDGERLLDAAVRTGLHEHYERALQECYEFAESRSLPLAQAFRSSESRQSPGNSR